MSRNIIWKCNLASLAIDRVVFFSNLVITREFGLFWRTLFWTSYSIFLMALLSFVAHTFDKSFTWVAVFICFGCTALTPLLRDYRLSVITFYAGSAVGYSLEVWGTTRACWTYYTFETPPLFAIFAHGMAGKKILNRKKKKDLIF